MMTLRETYKGNSQTKFKTSMLKSGLFGYSDPYILVKGTIESSNTGTAAVPNNRKNNIVQNCAPFTDCISGINNTTKDNAKDIDVVMPMYNFIKYSNNYSKTSEVYGNTIEINHFYMLMGYC